MTWLKQVNKGLQWYVIFLMIPTLQPSIVTLKTAAIAKLIMWYFYLSLTCCFFSGWQGHDDNDKLGVGSHYVYNVYTFLFLNLKKSKKELIYATW